MLADEFRTHVRCDQFLCNRIIGLFNDEKTHVYFFDFRETRMEHIVSRPSRGGTGDILFNRIVGINRPPTMPERNFALELPVLNLLSYYTSLGNSALLRELASFEPTITNSVAAPVNGSSVDIFDPPVENAHYDYDTSDISFCEEYLGDI